VTQPKVVETVNRVVENEVVEVLLLVKTHVVDKLAVYPILRSLAPEKFAA
jgi:hypothetical protein